jgi:hypothetical protein
MKVLVKLAMLVATLLLVANISFAASCDEQVCYAVTVTYQDDTSHGELWNVCLNDDATGYVNGPNPLYLFGDGPLWSSYDKHPKWTKWIIHIPAPSLVVGDIWTDIYGMFLFGEGYAGSTVNMRWKVTGKKVPCP